MARIILEGMDHDRVNVHFDTLEDHVPQDTGALVVGRNTLPLVDAYRRAREITAQSAATCTLPSPFESAQTAIVIHPDAVRVYSIANRERLKFTLGVIEHHGGFDKAYETMEREPMRFSS